MRAFAFHALISLPALSLASIQGAAAQACDKEAFRVVVDVGHSVASPGATSARGRTEYSFNLALASVVEKTLAVHGFVKGARMVSSAGPKELGARVSQANGLRPNLLLSVHHDSAQKRYLETWQVDGREQLYTDRFRGWSIFVSRSNPNAAESSRFATLLADRLLARGLPFTTHHAEPIPGESRAFLDASRGIYRFDGLKVLAGARAPAVLLEAGVIVNRQEELALSGSERRNAIATAAVEAVEAFCARAGAPRGE